MTLFTARRVAFVLSAVSFSAFAAAAPDQTFIDEASKGGSAEVAFSQLALKTSADESVKAFAQKMVDDHTKAGDELKVLLAKRSMTAPEGLTGKTQKKFEELQGKSGLEFDKAYVAVMVEDHKKTVKLFEDESKKGKDAEMKEWATATLPTLKMHLGHVQELEKTVKARK